MRPLEWRKTLGGSATEWAGGGQIVSGQLDPPRRGRGGDESSQDDSTPNRGGGGVESWQDDSTPKENGVGSRVVMG